MTDIECHGLDTPERVCFYEQDFYVLSNFSSFTIMWMGWRFDTAEAVYHWEKFDHSQGALRDRIRTAASAHEAFTIAQAEKARRRPDWDEVKIDVMRAILRAKVEQHEYVRRKLLATGERELVENSWRDDFWGWGPNGDGQNMLGKLWMALRAELRAQILADQGRHAESAATIEEIQRPYGSDGRMDQPAAIPRTCETCEHEDLDVFADPCCGCGWHDMPNWTPKPIPSTTDKGEKP